ncbi:prolipoprotein diacylglyceryl transferase [Thermodesulfobacteriota bacterium]
MHPELFSIGGFVVESYHSLVLLGGVLGLIFVLREVRRTGADPDLIYPLLLVVFISFIIGARIFTVIVFQDLFRNAPLRALRFWEGGTAYYGGLVASIVAVLAYSRLKGIDPWSTGDLFAPAAAIGLVFSRLGCFMAGCCYGNPCGEGLYSDLVCMRFTEGSPLRHPTQLYSSAGALLILGLLLHRRGRKRFEGELSATFLVVYPILRFMIEFFRADPRGSMQLGPIELSSSQVVGIPTFLFGLGLFLFLPRKQEKIHLPMNKET